MNTLLDTFEYARKREVQIYLNVGNHSLLNEKSKDHALRFLENQAVVVDKPGIYGSFNFIPYQHNQDDFYSALLSFPLGSIVFCHQGFLGAQMGDYIQDKSSIDPQLVKDFTVISGHYHRHQTIGTVTYIGSPYTITFGEANDGPKGFLIINEDGSFMREILNLRKHVIIQCNTSDLVNTSYSITKEDLVWVKLTGSQSDLLKVDKNELGMKLFGHKNYKLDKIIIESIKLTKEVDKLTLPELMDELIDQEPDSDEHKAKLKQLWRSLK